LIVIPKQRTLDFDCESRPLSFLGSDYTTDELTAIAWSWADEDDVQVRYLPPGLRTQADYAAAHRDMEGEFAEVYSQAGLVTGHYIRNFDMGMVQAGLVEWGRPTLGPKLTIDTKNDLIRFKGLSKSQENLGEMLAGLLPEYAQYLANKEHMNTPRWRKANRLTEEGVKETLRRVVGDVRQHKQLRLAMQEKKLLHPPKMWRP
jgi:hypothetical protein